MFKKKNLELMQNTPRRVSWLVLLNAFFGGATSVLGVGFLTLGLTFSVVFLKNFNIDNLNFLIKPYQTVPAIVVEKIDTGASHGKTKTLPGEKFYKIVYQFQPVNSGEQVLTGRDFIFGEKLKLNETVQIDYLLENQQITRLAGKIDWYQYSLLMVLLFPLVGLCFFISNLRQGWKYASLLCFGQIAYGELGPKESTNVSINDFPQFKMGFAFKAKDGQIYKTYIKTIAPENLEDDKGEALLYDSNNPSRAMLLDEFPGDLYLSFEGEIKAAKVFKSFVLLLQPLVLIVLMLFLFGILKIA